jgi:hypothetical protein
MAPESIARPNRPAMELSDHDLEGIAGGKVINSGNSGGGGGGYYGGWRGGWGVAVVRRPYYRPVYPVRRVAAYRRWW